MTVFSSYIPSGSSPPREFGKSIFVFSSSHRIQPKNMEHKKRFKLCIPISVKKQNKTETGYGLIHYLKQRRSCAIAMSYLLVNHLDKFSLSYKCSIFHAAKEFFLLQVYPCVCRILVVSHEDSPSLRSGSRLILSLCFQDFLSLGT